MDLSVNKLVKSFQRNEFQTWYAKEVCSQLQRHTENKPVDLKPSIVKLLGANRVKSCYDYFKS